MANSYQDGYRLLTAHIDDSFIVLPNWETKPQAPCDIPLSHSILTLSTEPTSLCPILIMPSSWLGGNFTSLNDWFESTGFDAPLIRQPCVIVWCVVCDVCGVWCVVCGVWCVMCGVWCMVCSMWCVVYGVWCVVCGSVVVGVIV